MSGERTIAIDRYGKDDSGAYGLVVEFPGQAPILLEKEGSDSSYRSCLEQIQRFHSNHQTLRYCIVRLVPVGGNELLLLDLERLQKLSPKSTYWKESE